MATRVVFFSVLGTLAEGSAPRARKAATAGVFTRL